MSESSMAQRLARLEVVQSVVLEISRRASRCQDLRGFFEDAHAAIGRIMRVGGFHIALRDARTGRVGYAHWSDEAQPAPDPDLAAVGGDDEGPTGWVIRHGKPLSLVPGESTDDVLDAAWAGVREAGHWLGMPLLGNDGIAFGAIAIQSRVAGVRYSDEDIVLFALLSAHVAGAIEHARYAVHMEEAVAERTRKLAREVAERRHAEALQRALYEISALSIRDIDLQAFYAELHRILGGLLYAVNFTVMLYDETDRDYVWFPYYADDTDDDPSEDFRRPSSQGLTGYLMRTRTPQRIEYAHYRSLVAAGQVDPVPNSPAFHVWIGAPMMYQGAPIGAIILQSHDPAIGFTDDDLALLTFVADHITAALSRKQADDALRAAHARLTEGSAALQLKNAELEKTLGELRQTQGELMRQEKLASLGALVAGIAHEINTPLGICVTAVSHLSEETRHLREQFADRRLTEKGLQTWFESTDDTLRILAGNTNRASGLVRSFKQVAVDRSSDDVREFAVVEYIEEVLKSLRPQLKRTRHAIAVACDPELRVRCVPGALSQILTHLVLNAIVHGFEHIEEGHIRIGVTLDASHLTIDFRDDGMGMPAEAIRRLFDPFYTTKRGQGNSGLGANIVYNLVTAKLGGSIAVDSAPGQGLHYCIRLPVQVPRVAVAGDGEEGRSE